MAEIKTEIESARRELEKADELLTIISDNELLCPHCNAPLVAKEYSFWWLDDGDGGDIDVEYGFVRYQCGYKATNGCVQTECSTISQKSQ